MMSMFPSLFMSATATPVYSPLVGRPVLDAVQMKVVPEPPSPFQTRMPLLLVPAIRSASLSLLMSAMTTWS